MAVLEITQIQNVALKATALEVDTSGNKDGYIDSTEISLFKEKAKVLLNEKKCTAQEFATLFGANEVDKTNTMDVFAKVDSLHNAKNTPEAFEKELKACKINEIESKIINNDKKLELYETRLSQKEILNTDYLNDIKGEKSFSEKANIVLLPVSCVSGLLTGVGALSAFIDGGLTALCVSGLTFLSSLAMKVICDKIDGYKNKKALTPEMQEIIRNAYKEAYLKTSQENEKLKAQLAELNK